MSETVPLKILYVEDEPDLRERIRIVLEMQFHPVLTAASGKQGLELFRCEEPDLVVSDIMMPVMDGLEMAREIRRISPHTPVVFTTAFTETAYLLQAIELGVFAYVRKPLDCRELVDTIMRAATPLLQLRELEAAKEREEAPLQLILGESPAIREVIRQAQRLSGTDFSVLIQGETGAGKSHLAALIHRMSRRRDNPFVTVSIAAFPETLIESQLFGHVKGAFTGAVSASRGLLEEARGGTLFLDDIDGAPPGVQAKILQAVEQKRFIPVGGTRPVEAEIRLITASNRDLLEVVREGRFREDLYYRIGDAVIHLPPLRERPEDIPPLARTFLAEVSAELQRTPPLLPPESMLLLTRHAWPGNIRQLKSIMKRAALFSGDAVKPEDLAGLLSTKAPVGNSTSVLSLEELKEKAVRESLAATGGKKMAAARMLDVEYGAFKRMLKKYGIG